MESHLSPTNIANYFHNQCQLYLHNSFHRSRDGVRRRAEPAPLVEAQFERGLAWEEFLFNTLDSLDQLVRIESSLPKTATEIRDIILEAAGEENTTKYIVNLAFQSPSFSQELLQHGSSTSDVAFGVAKPDIVKITHIDHEIIWEIIDAKASSALKSSHNAQIGFYHLCLENLLDSVLPSPDSPILIPSDKVSIWMPDPEHQDRLSTPVSTPTSLLLPPLRRFLFKDLPQILKKPRDSVEWHLNPSCQGCEFFDNCRQNTLKDKRLGMIPNLPISDARFIREVLEIASELGLLRPPGEVTEIEELDSLVKTNMHKLESKYPPTSKRFQRLLGVQKTNTRRWSPILDAALAQEPQLTRQRVFTFPRSEDVAIYISIINEIATGKIGAFCISVRARPDPKKGNLMSHQTGSAEELIPVMAKLLRKVLKEAATNRTQVYTYSPVERSAIMNHLIKEAVSGCSQVQMNEDIRLCLGALCEGTALLATSFQPLILSGVLLFFLSKKNTLSKTSLQTCCSRLELDDSGTIEDLRKRIEAEQRRLAELGGRSGNHLGNREVGQLGKVVVLKQEVERLLSLPIPGFVDLPQTAEVLLGTGKVQCPTDDVLYSAWVKKSPLAMRWDQGLKDRNRCMRAVVDNVRQRVSDSGLTNQVLLNEAKVLEVGMLDICETVQLRKLMFMLQFEVVFRLQTLWQDRLNGCPDAPLLRYVDLEKKGTAWHHIFDIVSKAPEHPVEERAFYDWLLVEEPDVSESMTVPPEIYFDDLSVCSLFFPLTRYTRPKWEEQLSIVKDNVFIANVNDIRMATGDSSRSQAVVQICYNGKTLKKGSIYRISPRLVDFNFGRILLNLVTMDFEHSLSDVPVPFMDLILDPPTFADSPSFCGEEELQKERLISQDLSKRAKPGSEDARALVLKSSQHRAAMRMMMKRLSVIWGPPGTGKTYTLALSTLRMLEVLSPRAVDVCPCILVTAMTHAAITAIVGKIQNLLGRYKALKDRDTSWLDCINLERIMTGSTHKVPSKKGVHIFAGTTFQLFKFCEKANLRANLIIIDEAGQLALGTAALAIRWLSDTGKLVLAGDHEQLAPILGVSYPESEPVPIFGSVLDMLIGAKDGRGLEIADTLLTSQESDYAKPVVQLLENFRLNADLGAFIETIYAKHFEPMKYQAPEISESLQLWLSSAPSDDKTMEQARVFLLNLGDAMDPKKMQTSKLTPPQIKYIVKEGAKHTVSLALIRVKALKASILPYEAHVKAEARLAAALVHWIRESFGNEESIFVACPHRIQRSAVRQAIFLPNEEVEVDEVDELAAELAAFHVSDSALRVDTVERLQGSEATFVIFLLSHTHSPSLGNHLAFLLNRRRLNVGISRAKSLCIVVSSRGVLQPSLEVLTKDETRKGLEFLRDYEERAWTGDIDLDIK